MRKIVMYKKYFYANETKVGLYDTEPGPGVLRIAVENYATELCVSQWIVNIFYLYLGKLWLCPKY